MRAMILAAGRGERMGELTQNVPKPLLQVNNHYLIEYSLQALYVANITEVVINVCYRKEQIQQALGDGSRYGMNIIYSIEDAALETGGGIYQALPLLGQDPFVVLSCDVVSDFSLAKLLHSPIELAHLVLVDNPSYHPGGDFCLSDQRVYLGADNRLTFGNIGIYNPELFAACKPGRFRLGDVLKTAISAQKVTGEHYQGKWHNVGTPADLAEFQAMYIE